jgi:hypothetical protein
MRLSFDATEEKDITSHYSALCQLAKEGYIDARWSVSPAGGPEIDQLVLTTAGRKLLEDLRVTSKAGRLKARAIAIFWSVITSAVTAFIVAKLAMKH